MTLTDEELHQAAEALRTLALDEMLKSQVMSRAPLAAAARRMAGRYLAGSSVADALQRVAENAQMGRPSSVECLGESVRDREIAEQETQEFLNLAAALNNAPSDPLRRPTISFDLSHIGSIVDTQLGIRNALRIAQAARDAGTYLMISAESAERTDLVLGLWERIASDFPETGITLQARLHRSVADLPRILRHSGPVRLVKGAFKEALTNAAPRNSALMHERYRDMASSLVRAGHRVNLATHDAQLVQQLQSMMGEQLRAEHVEFELLQGLGPQLLDELQATGYRVREYVVYGEQWWLYALNRMAEHPLRAVAALSDLADQG